MRFILASDVARQRAIEAIQRAPSGHAVTIGENVKDKTAEQRGKFHALCGKVGKEIALQLSGDAEAFEAEIANPFAPIPSFWSDQFDVSLLAYGLLDEADDIRLLEGEVGGDCIYGYFIGDDMVGVCGIGMRSKVMAYRSKVGLTPNDVPASS